MAVPEHSKGPIVGQPLRHVSPSAESRETQDQS